MVILSIVILVLLGPLVVFHFTILGSRTHYQIYPLIFLAIAWIFASRWIQAEAAEDLPRPFAEKLLLAGCLVVIPVALLYYSSWPAMFALVLAVGAVAIHLSAFRKVENLFGIWCLFLLFVRPPDQIEGRILRFMEGLSAKTASLVLDFLSIPHVIQGDIFAMFGEDIDLSDLCTGHVSLVSTVAITALVLVLRNRNLLHSLILLLSAVAVTWALNTIKIVLVSFALMRFDFDLTQGLGHGIMVVVSILLSLVMVFACDMFLRVCLATVSDTYALMGMRMSKMARKLAAGWDWLVSFEISGILAKWRTHETRKKSKTWSLVLGSVVTVYLVGLLAMEATILYHRQGDYQVKKMHSQKELTVIGRNDIAFIRPGWKVMGYEEEERDHSNVWGAFSNIWRLKYNDVTCIMALDYPFDKWHDVKRCYTIQGWKVFDENIIRDSRDFRWGVSQTDMNLPTGDFGFILCSHCNHLGGTVQPKPTTHDFSMVTHYLHPKQWSAPFGISVDKNKNTFYQTQAMVTTSFELDEETKQEIRLMYADFREQCRQKIQQHAMQP